MKKNGKIAAALIGSGAVMAAALLLLLLWMVLVEPERLRIRSAEVELAGLPPELDGLRVALLSDFHAFPEPPSPELLDQAAAAITAARPDLICLLGDYVRGRRGRDDAGSFPEITAYFRRFTAPLGVYAVSGNHEMWHGTDLVESALSRAGVVLLANRSCRLNWRGQDFHVAGLADFETGAPDFSRAMEEIPESAFTLVLAHNPRLILEVPPERNVLMVSGHTHGGQVRLPYFGDFRAALFRNRQWEPEEGGDDLPGGRLKLLFEIGLHRLEQRRVYVTSGLGGDRLRLRLLCPPEVVVLTLRSPGRAVRPEPLHDIRIMEIKR